MPTQKNAISNQVGFTIIELLIATAVFSVILLICAAALIQIGRSYQKGVIRSQTQEVARSVSISISEAIQFTNEAIVPDIGTIGVKDGFCIGNKRYSFVLDRMLVDVGGMSNPSDQTYHALVVDPVRGCSSLTPAQNMGGTMTVDSKELLSVNMRVSDISIESLGGELYRVSVKVAYGDRDLITGSGCVSTRLGGAYCAVSELSTVVKRRIVRQ